MSEIPVVREPWRPSYRLIPTRFPPVGLFDRVADPADLEAVFAIESLTNPRLREEVGALSLVAPEERVSGPGTTPIMASFTHLNREGSRFSDGSFGVYYCARGLETAIRETVYHRARFLARSREPAMQVDMRAYLCDLDAPVHDIRDLVEAHPEWYHPDDYAASQGLGRALRAARSWGVVYRSVRHPGGECAAVLRPRALARCRQGRHYAYLWDGTRITEVIEQRGAGVKL